MDPQEAERLCAEAMRLFGGQEGERDPARAEEIFGRVAGSGYSQGFFGLAEMRFSKGGPQGVDAAVELYRRAADMGNLPARYRLGQIYVSVRSDPEQGFRCFRECCENGFVQAYAALGDCYFYGVGTAKDLGKAVEVYRKGADAGDGTAAFKLGCIFEGEMGVPRDENMSQKMFLIAARKGNPQAQFLIANMAYEGKIEGGRQLAAEWFRICSDSIPVAKFNYATMCYTGDGVPKDLEKAFGLFLSLADAGDPDAMFQAGKMMLSGEGTSQDPHRGFEYIAKAAKAGNADAAMVVQSMLRRQNAQFIKIDGAE